MDRVLEILRALLLRALSEHARAGAEISDICIETASEVFEPRLVAVFSDDYRIGMPVRAADCYAYCLRHSISDQESFRAALLAEARTLYARLCLEHGIAHERNGERRAGSGRQAAPLSLLERLRRWRQGCAQRFSRRREALRPQRRAQGEEVVRFRPTFRDGNHPAAEARGLDLLRANLSPAQRTQFVKYQCFDVVGGKTGNRYRIRYGRQMNIEQIDKRGRRVCGWCFFPRGGLVAGDVMLGQKLALELFEAEALAVAQRYRVVQELDFPA
jgi:hypothetical protein